MITKPNVKRYCSEDIRKIENYEQAVNDKTQTWDCHHRLEIQGQFRNSTSLLKKCGLYYHVPAWQLIFLSHSEHRRLHNPWNKGKPLSDETRKKLSMLNSGEKNPAFGKHWWNNGAIDKRSRKCPGEGWVRGRLKRNSQK